MPPEKDSSWIFFENEDLAQNKASGIFYAVKAFPGIKNLFKTTKQTNKRKAKKELPRLIKEHLEIHEDGKLVAKKGKTVGRVIDEIPPADKKGKPLRKRTISKRKFYFDRIRKEMDLETFPIAMLERPIWNARLAKVRAGRERKTYGDYVKHANIMMRYAYDQKYVSHLVTFKNPDEKSEEGTVLTRAEISALWDVMDENLRDQFVLAYQCCMRRSEALHLSWDRVDLDSGLVTLEAEHVKTGSKTGKGREFYMPEEPLTRMRARKTRQDAKKPSHWVFPSTAGDKPVEDNKTAWNAAKEAVLKKLPQFQHWVRWHDLRHTAITRMLVEQEMNIVRVSEYVGTAAETLQRVYLHSKAEHTRGVTQNLRITDVE